MFAWWGRTVYRYRYIVIGVMVALCLGGGVYGISLGQHVTQSGFYDEGSESVHASVVADEAYGRDTSGHIIGDLHRPRGQDRRRPGLPEEDPGQPRPGREGPPRPDPALDRLLQEPRRAEEHGRRGQAARVHVDPAQGRQRRHDPEQLQDRSRTTCSRSRINGVDVKLAGLQPLASELTGTIGDDQKRAEVRGHPAGRAWCCSSCSAASSPPPCPAIIGGLTIAGALGIMRLRRRVRARCTSSPSRW